VVDLDESMARKAGETDFLMKKKVHNWPVADSIVYTTATAANARVVTGDPHFRSVENVIMI
jgi:predicted nucleic acid-binding protein